MMLVGAMNNPHDSLHKELERIGKDGFDFVDLTVEPTRNMPSDIDVPHVKKMLKKYGLEVVGHMGDWQLPKDSGYKSLRDASKKEIIDALRVLRRLGAKKVTLHSPRVEVRNYDVSRKRHEEIIRAALSEARKLKIELMLENNSDYLDDPRNSRIFHHVLKKFPALKVHIDVGHSNVGVNTNDTYKLLRRYGKRVRHFHFSDNHGSEDEHLKLGAGSIKWERIIKFLKNQGYDDTITVEVFRSGPAGEADSLRKLRKWWETC
ncbi:sugar phosphate isomerase/epimerase [Candidatus Woesearchaeota archaeon]|nr:sugar phosphate isomerase/epimerase [Candidatus Woesearchaeota archaeon]